jgi:hypothetical protein
MSTIMVDRTAIAVAHYGICVKVHANSGEFAPEPELYMLPRRP